MLKSPKIKLKIDLKQDIENAKWFVKNGQFVDWFLPRELYFILEEKYSTKQKNQFITDYTNQTFEAKKGQIKAGVEKSKFRWQKTEKSFFNFANDLFQDHKWPAGKYIGYASIFKMFPRDIKNKTFFFPYSDSRLDPIQTIAHELLHFIFFDYVKKKYKLGQHSQLKNKAKNYIWQVSEAFNTTIENSAEFKKIFHVRKNCKPYPECRKIYTKMNKQWQQNQDVEKLLDYWIG
ncbi:hypothetical protein A2533_00645 [Candidatus Falkowbacteria bacterium RIFOXYD2_FULL_35_9]|uniref:Uncharacterized protein n=1 Tax=Candidatus Falkowbacteria bacterium RIFOXYC2_FULL_36_12 TaxID=1798002 RepID=A0A1F5T0Z9_9BACT|nr:MAG: hypothetical protein A2300_00015 [Candidatus Falkowbacteria bacterium RIFOXYB2_FULL_35_7]OGF32423.1 MAG: hypothetical protein A2478_03830 [Candidatus Falkowbacteria bacterium RIFOXYC2_FULL_36_12]OGF46772.1 MAG: hypothetical protein A2533_00645 [Candidatus Falkowbacteria bacterium RIFOXYD2_FULL_35_9]